MNETSPEKMERPMQEARPLSIAHRHVEAFRLMLFSSMDGKEIETIWNSRDGVTPFIVASKRDGVTELRHIMWGGDPYAPHHIPNLGDRVFVDITPDVAELSAKRTVERYWNEPDAPWSEQFKTKEDAIASVFAELSKPGAPTIVETNLALQQGLVQRRSELSQRLQRKYMDQKQGIPLVNGSQPPETEVGSG